MKLSAFLRTAAAWLLTLAAPAAFAQDQTTDWSKVPPPERQPELYGYEAAQGNAAATQAEAQPAAFESFPNALDPKEITPDMVGQDLVVTGRILSVSPSRNDRMPTTLMLNESPAVAVVYWPDIAPQAQGTGGVPQPGTMVTARGTAGEFRGTTQVAVRAPGDILIQGSGRTMADLLGPLSAQERAAVGAVTAANPAVAQVKDLRAKMGEDVILLGSVGNMREAWSETAPNILTLQGATGSADVVFWSDVRAGVKPELLKVGTPVVLAGNVGEYRGNIQVRLSGPEAIARIDAEKLAAQTAQIAAKAGIAPVE